MCIGGKSGDARIRIIHIAADPPPQEKTDGQEIGYVEAFKNERDGAIERGVIADIDESKERRKDCHDENSDYRNGSTLLDLDLISGFVLDYKGTYHA